MACGPARYIHESGLVDNFGLLSERRQSKLAKFMQSIDMDVYRELESLAEARDVSLQEFIRAVVIPEWLRWQEARTRPPSQFTQEKKPEGNGQPAEWSW